MSKIPANPEIFDKTEIFVSGIPLQVYNLKSLEPYLKTYNDEGDQPNPPEIPINVMYLFHGRLCDYTSTEEIGAYVAEHYLKNKDQKPDVPLIFITYDLPNHGVRKLSDQQNKGWNSGNDKHGPDMVSLIDGSVSELKLIMDQLEFHLNLDQFLPQLSDYKFQFHNILSGFSLGGHIIFRFTQKYPNNVDIICPLIGSCDLSSLLIDRLLKIEPSSKKRFLQEYSELGLSKDQKLKYPKTFHEYLRKIDDAIFDNFPLHTVKMFAAFGGEDTLVPSSYTRTFCQLYQIENPSTEVFVQPDSGHVVTVEMLDKFVEWLSKQI